MFAAQDLILKIAQTHDANLNELEKLLAEENPEQENFLAKVADEVRQKFVGDAIHLRGLVEFSSFCKRTCKYCGLRCENHLAKRFRLAEEEILFLVKKAIRQFDYKTIVLQSGEDDFFTVERLESLLKKIKALGVAITLSIGERETQEYARLKLAGADRFLLRIETTDKNLYQKLHPNMSFENRLRCLKDLKKFGFEVGTGVLIGLPEQNYFSLARDIKFFKEINADMIGVGPLIANPQTPLANVPPVSFGLVRRVVALCRLLAPDTNIPATTAMGTLKENGRIEILQSGANVIMPNLTEGEARKSYALYPNKANMNDTPEMVRRQLEKSVMKIGRTIGKDFGFRKKS